MHQKWMSVWAKQMCSSFYNVLWKDDKTITSHEEIWKMSFYFLARGECFLSTIFCRLCCPQIGFFMNNVVNFSLLSPCQKPPGATMLNSEINSVLAEMLCTYTFFWARKWSVGEDGQVHMHLWNKITLACYLSVARLLSRFKGAWPETIGWRANGTKLRGRVQGALDNDNKLKNVFIVVLKAELHVNSKVSPNIQ